MRRIAAAWVAALWCLPVGADEIDVSFNSDAVRGEYVHPFASSSLQIDGGWLHHTDNGNAVHVGLNLADLASDGVDPVKAGLGGRLVYSNGDLSGQDGFALALGGFLRYTVPRFNRVAVTGKVYFAPDVLSLGDAEKWQDYTIDLSYNVMREADIYIGARYVRGDYKNVADARYDTGMHIGINLRF